MPLWYHLKVPLWAKFLRVVCICIAAFFPLWFEALFGMTPPGFPKFAPLYFIGGILLVDQTLRRIYCKVFVPRKEEGAIVDHGFADYPSSQEEPAVPQTSPATVKLAALIAFVLLVSSFLFVWSRIHG